MDECQERFLVHFKDTTSHVMKNNLQNEHELLAMVNGALSHELRNPLNTICT